MSVRRHQLQLPILDHHQQAVQVVTDVLLRHCVLHETKQPTQRFLGEHEARGFAGGLCQAREILGRQCLQRKAALACLNQQAFVLLLQRDLRVLRESPQDVDQLARTHSHGARVAASHHRAARGDLDLDVGGQERQRLCGPLDQDVGQDRQRVSTFDDSAYRRKRVQDVVALVFDQDHVVITF